MEKEPHRKVLIAIPIAMLDQVDFIASCEHRTRTDLVREALRRYLYAFKVRHSQPQIAAKPAVTSVQIIEEVPTHA